MLSDLRVGQHFVNIHEMSFFTPEVVLLLNEGKIEVQRNLTPTVETQEYKSEDTGFLELVRVVWERCDVSRYLAYCCSL